MPLPRTKPVVETVEITEEMQVSASGGQALLIQLTLCHSIAAESGELRMVQGRCDTIQHLVPPVVMRSMRLKSSRRPPAHSCWAFVSPKLTRPVCTSCMQLQHPAACSRLLQSLCLLLILVKLIH